MTKGISQDAVTHTIRKERTHNWFSNCWKNGRTRNGESCCSWNEISGEQMLFDKDTKG